MKTTIGSKMLIVIGKALDDNNLFLIEWDDDIIKETAEENDPK